MHVLAGIVFSRSEKRVKEKNPDCEMERTWIRWGLPGLQECHAIGSVSTGCDVPEILIGNRSFVCCVGHKDAGLRKYRYPMENFWQNIFSGSELWQESRKIDYWKLVDGLL